MTAMLKIKKLPVSFFELTFFFRKESTNSPRIETIDILFRIQNPNFLKIKKKNNHQRNHQKMETRQFCNILTFYYFYINF